MAQVKQHERELINQAASHYLSDQEEGDLYDAYQKLEKASKEGQGDKSAMDYVLVWQPLENKTVDEILDYITVIHEGSKTTYEDNDNPIKKIDFTELRNQKRLLLETINNDAVSPEHKEGLEGILNLIDNVQDYAVDVLGWDEKIVFDIED